MSYIIWFRLFFPIKLCSLQQTQCAHHVGTCKGERIFDRAVYMALGSQMYDAVNMVFLHELLYSVEVTDVGLHERVVRLILNVLEVSQIAGISQLVEVYDVILWIFVYEQSYYMTANESGSAGDYYVAFESHSFFIFGVKELWSKGEVP